MKRLSGEDFLEIFIKTTSECLTPSIVRNKYNNNKEWTKVMLDSKSGILSILTNKLSQTQDWKDVQGSKFYYIDFVIGSGDMFRNYGFYPYSILAAIEHENGFDLGPEMYQLAFFRSPLKIIIGYDWDEDKKITEKRKKGIDNGLEIFSKFLNKCSEYCREEPEVEYLVIIGDRKYYGADEVNWRAWRFNSLGRYSQIKE